MKRVHQTVFGDGKGNCFAACIASILEQPIDAVPNFCGDFGDAWWEETQRWLAARGLYAIEFTIHRPEDGGWFRPFPDSVHIVITGRSPRGDFGHCVVGRLNGERIDYVHDPHPSGDGLAGPPEYVLFLAPLDPVALSHGGGA